MFNLKNRQRNWPHYAGLKLQIYNLLFTIYISVKTVKMLFSYIEYRYEYFKFTGFLINFINFFKKTFFFYFEEYSCLFDVSENIHNKYKETNPKFELMSNWKYLFILFRKQFLSMEWQGLLAVVEETLEWQWQLLLRNITDNFNQIMKIVSHYSTCSYYTAAGFFLFKKTFDFCVNSLRTLSK